MPEFRQKLDAALRQRERIREGGSEEGTEIYHYAGSSDSPVWIEEQGEENRPGRAPSGLWVAASGPCRPQAGGSLSRSLICMVTLLPPLPLTQKQKTYFLSSASMSMEIPSRAVS